MIDYRISSAVNEGDRPASTEFSELEECRVAPKLPPIAAGEFHESLRPVIEPAPQRRARRHVLHPLVEFSAGLSDPARPQPIDQDPKSVLRDRGVVRSLDAKAHVITPARRQSRSMCRIGLRDLHCINAPLHHGPQWCLGVVRMARASERTGRPVPSSDESLAPIATCNPPDLSTRREGRSERARAKAESG
jgi:hypothetical protein